MSITNIYEIEPLIEAEMKKLVNPELVFMGVDMDDLDNTTFTAYEVKSERVGVVIINAGFKTDGIRGSRKTPSQKIKMFWQIAVVSPKELYKTNAGETFVKVVKALIGKKLSKEFTELELIDDERDFNVPQFSSDLTWQPMMFSVETII